MNSSRVPPNSPDNPCEPVRLGLKKQASGFSKKSNSKMRICKYARQKSLRRSQDPHHPHRARPDPGTPSPPSSAFRPPISTSSRTTSATSPHRCCWRWPTCFPSTSRTSPATRTTACSPTCRRRWPIRCCRAIPRPAPDLKLVVQNAPSVAHAFLSMHQALRRAGERLAELDDTLERTARAGRSHSLRGGARTSSTTWTITSTGSTAPPRTSAGQLDSGRSDQDACAGGIRRGPARHPHRLRRGRRTAGRAAPLRPGKPRPFAQSALLVGDARLPRSPIRSR